MVFGRRSTEDLPGRAGHRPGSPAHGGDLVGGQLGGDPAALGIQGGSPRRMAAVGARTERCAGAILVLLGVLLLTDSYDVLASRFAGLAPQIGSA